MKLLLFSLFVFAMMLLMLHGSHAVVLPNKRVPSGGGGGHVHSGGDDLTPLDRYVYKFDPAFTYSIVKSEKLSDMTVMLINMTSQTWQNEKIVKQPLWYHYIVLGVPHELKIKDHGMLFINGGSLPHVPKLDDQMVTVMTKSTGSIVASLYDIPVQPFTFWNDTVPSRVEDAIVAYTWEKFIETNDPYWLLRFPMVKASVRAMDVIQDVVAKQFGVSTLSKFAVGGASKRGWTAWLTAAVDTKRVTTVIPLVIDVVNMVKVFTNIHNSLCGWPEAMKDYVQQGVTKYIGTPSFVDLAQQVDPFVFRERLRNTEKMIISAANDQFFWPDGSTFSFHELPGTAKRIRYVPNAEHSLSGTDVTFTTASYYYAILNGVELPDYTFDKVDTASGAKLTVRVTNGKKPTQVLLWSCTNPTARDFRITTTGKCYQSVELSPEGDNQWSATVATPATGYTAFFIELTFGNYFTPMVLPAMKFTTSGYIIPETTPCH